MESPKDTTAGPSYRVRNRYLLSPAASQRRLRLQREKARILAGNLFEQDTDRLAAINAELDTLTPR